MIPDPAKAAPERRGSRGDRWALCATVAVLAAVAAIRLLLLNCPLERDEGEYAYAGQLMLQGIPPYQLAYNMKFPGTYAAYALIMAAFGQTPAGIHLGVVGVTTLTASMLYALGARILDRPAGFGAATAYALLAAQPKLLGLAGHATHFAALFVTAAAWLLLAREPVSRIRAGAAGLMIGAAILMKQHAALFAVWGMVLLATAASGDERNRWTQRGWALAGFCAGTMVPLAVTALILWRAGVFERFWFWTILYAGQYVSEGVTQGAQLLRFTAKEVFSRGSLLWLTAAAGLVLIGFEPRLAGRRRAIAGFALAAVLTTCPGWLFRTHYFLLVLPAAALLAGCALSAARRRRRPVPDGRAEWSWPVLVYSGVLAACLFENRDLWFTSDPVRASRLIYPANPFPEAATAAAWIRAHSPPDARLAVLGSEPEIYFLAHRRSATGYLYTYPLMEPQPFARRMQEEMIHEIESVHPAYVVRVVDDRSWLRRVNSVTDIFDWWAAWGRTNYDFEGQIDLPRDEKGAGLEIYRRR